MSIIISDYDIVLGCHINQPVIYFTPIQIKTMRERIFKLDQTDFSKLLGMSRTSICQWENDRRYCCYNTLILLNMIYRLYYNDIDKVKNAIKVINNYKNKKKYAKDLINKILNDNSLSHIQLNKYMYNFDINNSAVRTWSNSKHEPRGSALILLTMLDIYGIDFINNTLNIRKN
jgi:DNA-binding transcriptional regulator YiaG